MRWLELLVLGLFWWYPLAWWASRALRDAEELCCDAWVVWAAPDDAQAYASTLVETVGFLSGASARLPLGTSGAAPLYLLHRRLSMILQHPPSRRLSRPAYLALLLSGAIVLPLMPAPARTQSATPSESDRTVEQVIVQSPSCLKCHQVAGARAKKDEAPGDLHSKITRLLGELTDQRTRMRKTEDDLRNALKRFEEQTGKKPAPPAPPVDPNRRLDELDKKLEDILKELKELRRGREAPGAIRSTRRFDEVIYLNQRTLAIPVSIQPDRLKGQQVALYASEDNGRTYRLVSQLLPGTAQAFTFNAPKDGRYWFCVDNYPDTKSPPKTKSGANPQLTIQVDTVRPEVQLSAGLKGKDVEISWTIIEDNPDLETLNVEYRVAGTHEWTSLQVENRQSAVHRFTPRGGVAEIRVRVADRAGNKVVGRVPLAEEM